MKIIVSDAGPLIGLAKIGYLYLLKEIFDEVLIPGAVYDELKLSDDRPGSKLLNIAVNQGKWIKVYKVDTLNSKLMLILDMGEAEAIILAKKRGLIILVDEIKGRKVAKKESLDIIGTGRFIIAAKQKGIIQNVTDIIDELNKSGYRLSTKLCNKIKSISGE
ncbi:MAG: DUF3368 domain-containing protein [Spirochaetia bacterium]|jgi:predicted nucleic acid-binding protein|nr:DUF3368 domain-containing protein [Spirochaetia bacterium]